MQDANPNPFRNVAQDPDFLARNAKGQQQASPEAIAQYCASFEMQRDQDQITRAIAQYEEARMSQRPKPKFILEVINPYRARPSKATILDVVVVALMMASWAAILFGFYLLSK